MPANLLSNILRLTSAQIDLINDSVPGSSVATPTGNLAYAGQLGGWLVANETEAAGLGSGSTGLTLHAGIYQYVQFKAASTTAPAKGTIMYYASQSDQALYRATPDVTAATDGLIAGVALGAVTKGNYGFIQVAGVANVLFKASITKATPAIGDMVVVDGSSTNTADILADATGVTWATAKLALGKAVTLPVGAAISLVWLNPIILP